MKRLRRYCQDCFSASAIFTEPGDAQVIWLATRDRTRGAAAHRRSARAVLAKLHIPTFGLKGAWLILATEEAVRAAAAEHEQWSVQPLRNSQEARTDTRDVANVNARPPDDSAQAPDAASRQEGDVKVIELGRLARGAASPLDVEVLR